MKSVEWKTYRTRFLVRAKKLNYALSFTDHLGRQHCGRKGDYLVESFEGVLSIAPRQIFEDIYVPMPRAKKEAPDFARPASLPVLHPGSMAFEAIEMEELKAQDLQLNPAKLPGGDLKIESFNQETFRYPTTLEARRAHHDPPSRARRKLPQPVRPSTPRLGLM